VVSPRLQSGRQQSGSQNTRTGGSEEWLKDTRTQNIWKKKKKWKSKKKGKKKRKKTKNNPDKKGKKSGRKRDLRRWKKIFKMEQSSPHHGKGVSENQTGSGQWVGRNGYPRKNRKKGEKDLTNSTNVRGTASPRVPQKNHVWITLGDTSVIKSQTQEEKREVGKRKTQKKRHRTIMPKKRERP